MDIDAIPEGTVVFPHQPLIRVRGPILQGQLLETALLCLVNFNTLIATKAARMCQAAGNEPVLEFGLRRAQGLDGALGASRAAHVGGCASTSNVLAGKRYGIPVRGTHAHSWVMSFDDEEEAFEAYAQVMPNNCVFLVDTYDTLEGVRKAIAVARRLRDQPALGGVYKLAAIREPGGTWKPRVKLSEQAIKVSNPGIQNVRRFIRAGEAIGDVLWDEMHPTPTPWTMVDPADPTRRRDMPGDVHAEDLLVPVFRHGGLVYARPPLADIRTRTQTQLKLFHPGVRRLDNPHQYPVGLEAGLHERKTALILATRGHKDQP